MLVSNCNSWFRRLINSGDDCSPLPVAVLLVPAVVALVPPLRMFWNWFALRLLPDRLEVPVVPVLLWVFWAPQVG